MKDPKRYVLKKDIMFPAGTVFECVDGSKRTFISGNYEATVELTKDTSGGLVYGIDCGDPTIAEWFEAVE